MADENKHLVVFQDRKIRRIWHNDEWWFSVVAVVEALTESNNPRNYWSMLKTREAEQGIELSTNCVQLKLSAEDGKLRETDCANTKTLFRIIQSIPSKKATTDITKTRDALGFQENKKAAQRGGQIAQNARAELEQETGESVVSKNNFLNLTEKKKLENKNI